jgi:hypothetical protein
LTQLLKLGAKDNESCWLNLKDGLRLVSPLELAVHFRARNMEDLVSIVFNFSWLIALWQNVLIPEHHALVSELCPKNIKLALITCQGFTLSLFCHSIGD